MSSLTIVAGDPSGDAHAARLVEALRRRDSTLRVTALGGAALEQAGARLLDDLTRTAAIGPFDASRHLARFVRAKRRLARHLLAEPPDAVVLVDFGDFNLPVIAPLVKRHGLPVLYYISPQLWAWGRWRLRYVRRFVDRMIVLFPFEAAFYERAGIPVTWVGHPLVDHTAPSQTPQAALERLGLNPWRRTVGLLPGSRAGEIHRHLPLLLSAAERIAWQMPGVQFVLVQAPTVDRAAIDRALAHTSAEVHGWDGAMPDVLQLMETAIVASGTATLEAALHGVPMVVVYRTSWPTYLAARAVVRIPHIAMVNVVAERPIVPEFVQHRARPAVVARAMVELLRDVARLAAMRRALQEDVAARLGPGGAVDRAADVVLGCLRQRADRTY